MQTITALFDSAREADKALDRLAAAGIGLTRVAVHDRSIFSDRAAAPVAPRVEAPSTRFFPLDSGTGAAEASGYTRDDAPGAAPVRDHSAVEHTTARNAWGDFLDARSGGRLGSEFGSRRNALGDFLGPEGQRRGDFGNRRNALGDSLDAGGQRHGADKGRRNALGDFLDSDGRRRGADSTRRNAVGDFKGAGGERRGANATPRGPFGDFLDERGKRRGDEHAGGSQDSPSRHRGTQGSWQEIRHVLGADAHIYEEGLRRGGYLLVATVDDRLAASVTDMLVADGVVDLYERQRRWRSEGWNDAGNLATEANRRDRVRSYAGTDAPGGLNGGW